MVIQRDILNPPEGWQLIFEYGDDELELASSTAQRDGMLVQDDHGAGPDQDGPRPRRARSLIRSSYATLDSCVMLCYDSMDVPHYIATHHVSMRQTQGHTGSSQ